MGGSISSKGAIGGTGGSPKSAPARTAASSSEECPDVQDCKTVASSGLLGAKCSTVVLQRRPPVARMPGAVMATMGQSAISASSSSWLPFEDSLVTRNESYEPPVAQARVRKRDRIRQLIKKLFQTDETRPD